MCMSIKIYTTGNQKNLFHAIKNPPAFLSITASITLEDYFSKKTGDFS